LAARRGVASRIFAGCPVRAEAVVRGTGAPGDRIGSRAGLALIYGAADVVIARRVLGEVDASLGIGRGVVGLAQVRGAGVAIVALRVAGAGGCPTGAPASARSADAPRSTRGS